MTERYILYLIIRKMFIDIRNELNLLPCIRDMKTATLYACIFPCGSTRLRKYEEVKHRISCPHEQSKWHNCCSVNHC